MYCPGRVVWFGELRDPRPASGSRCRTWAGIRSIKLGDHPLWRGIPQDSRFYFVHSYYLNPRSARAGRGPNLVWLRLRVGHRARQHLRRAIPSGKERSGGTAPARQFRGLEPLTELNPDPRLLLEEPAMLLIPAIDLKDGKCVRLRQGRMEDSTVFLRRPGGDGGRWVEAGARRLHLVDLNGAFAGQPVNAQVIRRIAAPFPTCRSRSAAASATRTPSSLPRCRRPASSSSAPRP
jgi:hypothetical protein